MKEFTSTVTLTFDINNIQAINKNDYIEALKELYLDSPLNDDKRG